MTGLSARIMSVHSLDNGAEDGRGCSNKYVAIFYGTCCLPFGALVDNCLPGCSGNLKQKKVRD